jgi:hypothetical protein
MLASGSRRAARPSPADEPMRLLGTVTMGCGCGPRVSRKSGPESAFFFYRDLPAGTVLVSSNKDEFRVQNRLKFHPRFSFDPPPEYSTLRLFPQNCTGAVLEKGGALIWECPGSR